MNEFDILYDDLINDTLEAFSKLDDEIKEVYEEEAEFMYTEIKPKFKNRSRYRRGEQGSFADRKNFNSDITRPKKSIISYKLQNDRMTDCGCDYCSTRDIYLDNLIEEGIYGKTRLKKRPVSERVIERLNEEELIENILTSTLIQKGWNIK